VDDAAALQVRWVCTGCSLLGGLVWGWRPGLLVFWMTRLPFRCAGWALHEPFGGSAPVGCWGACSRCDRPHVRPALLLAEHATFYGTLYKGGQQLAVARPWCFCIDSLDPSFPSPPQPVGHVRLGHSLCGGDRRLPAAGCAVAACWVCWALLGVLCVLLGALWLLLLLGVLRFGCCGCCWARRGYWLLPSFFCAARMLCCAVRGHLLHEGLTSCPPHVG